MALELPAVESRGSTVLDAEALGSAVLVADTCGSALRTIRSLAGACGSAEVFRLMLMCISWVAGAWCPTDTVAVDLRRSSLGWSTASGVSVAWAVAESCGSALSS